MKKPIRKRELIEIIDGYAYDYDEYNYTLYEVGMREKGVFGKTEQKSGEMVEYKNQIGFYSNLTLMLKAVVDYEARKSCENANVRKIGDYLAIMDEISKRIENATRTTAF